MERAWQTGIVRIDGKLIIILDFEKIVADINPETGLRMSDVEEKCHIEQGMKHLYL